MYSVLDFDEYRDKKNLIQKFETAYGNARFFNIAMKQLSEYHERAAMAFSMYFGYKQNPMLLKDIGKKMDCSPTWAGKLSNRAFKYLIHPKYRKKIWEEFGYKPDEISDKRKRD
jgi:hypothetical protein